MKPRLVVGMLVLLCAGGVQAQMPSGASGPDEQVRQDAEVVVFELALTRVLGRVRITPSQAGKLAGVLDQAQQRLKSVRDRENQSLARLTSPVGSVYLTAAAGQKTPPIEGQVGTALQVNQSAWSRAVADLVVSIREQLPRIFSREQMQVLQAEAVNSFRPSSESGRLGIRASERGTTLNRRNPTAGPDQPAAVSTMLDGMRRMSDEQFARTVQAAAARGAGAGARGGVLEFAQQARGMTEPQYAAAKPGMLTQLRMTMYSITPNAALKQLIEFHLLHPATPGLLRRVATWGGGR